MDLREALRQHRRCLAHLERKNFTSIVTSPHVKGRTNVWLHEGDYTAHTKLAVWFGNETREISPCAVERSAMCVAIPMFGMIESLNLGTSSGIVLYEVTRQRRAYQGRFRLRDRRGARATPLPTEMPRGDAESQGRGPAGMIRPMPRTLTPGIGG